MFINRTKKVKNSNGGETGIRTLDTVAHILPFQGSAIDHSATSPMARFYIIRYHPAIFLNKLPTILSTFVLGISLVINAVLLLPFPGIINCLSFVNPSRHSTATS
mgnify:CR=1 FL=1